MEVIQLRNLVILALVQIGVLVGSILAAGAAHKWYTELPNIIPVPLACRALTEYGWAGLALPIGWLAATAALFARSSGPGRAGAAAVGVGVLLVALFVAAGWLGAAHPWLRLIFSYDSFG